MALWLFLYLFAHATDAQQTFECADNLKLPMDRLNDNFCDCADGYDEQQTSACSHISRSHSFVCANKGYRRKILRPSRVGDGICDCCDGSDERDAEGHLATTSSLCPDKCWDMGIIWRKAAAQLRTDIQTGLSLISESKADLQRSMEQWKQELQQVETEIADISTLADEITHLEQQQTIYEEQIQRAAKILGPCHKPKLPEPEKPESEENVESEQQHIKGDTKQQVDHPGTPELASQDSNAQPDAADTSLPDIDADINQDTETDDEAPPPETCTDAATCASEASLVDGEESAQETTAVNETTAVKSLREQVLAAVFNLDGFQHQQSNQLLKTTETKSKLPQCTPEHQELISLAHDTLSHSRVSVEQMLTGSAWQTDDRGIRANHDLLQRLSTANGAFYGLGCEIIGLGLLPPFRFTYNILAWIGSFLDPEYESTTTVADDAGSKKEKPMGAVKVLLTHVLQCAQAAWNAVPNYWQHYFGTDRDTNVRTAGSAALRFAANKVRKTLSDLKHRQKTLQSSLKQDYGPDARYHHLHGKCFEFPVDSYNYRLCPFESFKQDHTLLGDFKKANNQNTVLGVSCPNSHLYAPAAGDTGDTVHIAQLPAFGDEEDVIQHCKLRLNYTGGARCHNSKTRRATVDFFCGAKDEFMTVEERETCVYHARFLTPAVCEVRDLQLLPEED